MKAISSWFGGRSRGRQSSAPIMLASFAVLFLAMPLFATAQSAADYYVKSIPGQPDGPLLKMHAGHIEVDPQNNGNLFFWHFQNRHIANRQRTIIWLNGGPGCSSMDGALMEVGPYRLRDDHSLEYNNGSWDEFGNLLFVDNPVGTGYSYINTNSYLHDLPEMASQFLIFLQKFFEIFPEYENDDIYIAGESYAGQHIPYIGRAILDRNKNRMLGQASWNLGGLLIGNGWISPTEQYPAYLSYAYKEGLITEDSESARTLEALNAKCDSVLAASGGADRVSVPQCENILSELLRLTKDSNNQCYNMYDIRLHDEYSSCGMAWPPDLVFMKPYLRRNDVKKALNVNPDKASGWSECDGDVGRAFQAQHSLPSIRFLPDIIEAGIPILLFSGDRDLICNHLGTEQLIHNMKWNGGTGFEVSPSVWAPRRDWMFEGEPAGYYQQARNLTYVLFYNASHMVPFDFPRRTRDMLDRFMKVDIANIGGEPADSRLDGEQFPQTSVGGHPNSTLAEEQEKEKLKEAEWHAYAKSGEAVLVVVIIAISVWAFFIWRARRRHRGYKSVFRDDSSTNVSALERFRQKRSLNGDPEAADFDEAELDQLNVGDDEQGPGHSDSRIYEDMHAEPYAVGDDSDEDNNQNKKPSADSRSQVPAAQT